MVGRGYSTDEPDGATLWDAVMERTALGLFLVVYCPVLLCMPDRPGRLSEGSYADGLAGFVGGILGGVAGVSGPVPTLWTTIRGWEKDLQRGVLQAFNIAMHVGTLTAYILAGKVTSTTTTMFAIIAPALLLPAILGVSVFKRLSAVSFRRLILTFLFGSGVVMILGSITRVLALG